MRDTTEAIKHEGKVMLQAQIIKQIPTRQEYCGLLNPFNSLITFQKLPSIS